MKRLVIAMLSVLAASIAICMAAEWALEDTVANAREMATELFVAMEEDRRTDVREKLVELATFWDDRQPLLEVLCTHEDLHEIKQHIIEAEICIDYSDAEDFYTAVSLISEALEHIEEVEQLSLSNLY